MKNTALLSKIYRRHHITATHCGCPRDGYAAAPLASDRTQGHVSTSLIIAKSRVRAKITSIPRLKPRRPSWEAEWRPHCYRGARQKTERQILLTDSQTVLTWLKNGARSYKPFVAHRIAAIEENSTPNEWRWVSTNRTSRTTRPETYSKFRSMVQWARIPSTNQTTGQQKSLPF
ncbi:hypothetical protein EVAR_56090_1 [Eumeta japonica]|uniref:Uncharacterized protein n=1 Tax=Eumeta variegata TaxID=151549 RepID=A0A4C1YS45_EUMVA|nr:hypothetical protein EVAR_56090_1 [Eumeta japonica]